MITLDDLVPLRQVMSTQQLERYGDYLVGIRPAEPFTDEELSLLKERKKFYTYKTQCAWEWAACQKVMEQINNTLSETKSLVGQAIYLSNIVNSIPHSEISLSA